MPVLSDIASDVDQLLAYEPEELGLLLMPILEEIEQNRDGYSPENIVSRTMGPRTHPSQAAAMGGPYPNNRRDDIEAAVREAITWLHVAGFYIPAYATGNRPTFTRRGARFVREKDLRRASITRRLAKESLHPAIREEVWALYLRERYDLAVFEAMKAVEVAVREAGGYAHKEIGTNLMRQAFDPERGPLADNTSERAEREARSALFAGAIGSYKNPQSHRKVELDNPDEAIEIILLASHLLRIVDARAEARRDGQ